MPFRNNGKEHGNYHRILGLYRENGETKTTTYSTLELYKDHGKEAGNYHCILGVYRDNGKLYASIYTVVK